MTAPAFEFTHRAVPVVQMGRSARRDVGNRWQEGTWGTGRWGLKDWEVVWADLTCEIHEITTQTGRGGAADRFVPGTAAIVASNVNQISELIFPKVPETGEGIELVPQPPVTGEEDLQAPAAETIISNGWSFSDDFERAPPRWIFPAAWATGGDFPPGPFKPVEGGMQPELYLDPAISVSGSPAFEGVGVAQWTAGYPATESSYVEVTVDDLRWPAAPAAGTPTTIVELYVRTRAGTQECYGVRFTMTPNFTGANTITWRLFRRTAAGVDTAGTSTFPVAFGTGSNGIFPAATFRLRVDDLGEETALSAAYNGTSLGTWTADQVLTGSRVGYQIHYTQGRLTGGDPPIVPRATRVIGPDFEDPLTRPLGAGWVLHPQWRRERDALAMQAIDGAMIPTQQWATGSQGGYRGEGMAQFTADFAGDQVLELDIEGMSMPDEVTPPSLTRVEMYCHGSKQNQSAMVAWFEYGPDWDGDHNSLLAGIFKQGPNGEETFIGPDGDEASVDIDLGPIDGVFHEPDRWRFESNVDGSQRLYRNGVLMVEGSVVHLPDDGGRVGIYETWAAGSPDTGVPRPAPARITRVAGGLQSPLGTEELGMWVRIGVHHQTLGQNWFFRGFVDACVPTYVPDRQDAVRIECVDSLAEAGRVQVDGDQLSHQFAQAPTRIRQILDAASWPAHFRTIGDDSTFMSRPSTGKAVDALTQVAESCGGAVYGDPVTGDLVFKGQGWQGPAAGGDTLAYITNFNPGADYFDVPRICPSGWERSARRSDMVTRVKYSTATSDTSDGDPIVREWKYPAAERIYGVEKYERTLLCIDRQRVDELAVRQLHLRHPNLFPRIEAVVLDAATADEALDLMTTATFTVPSKYRCQHREAGGFVFDRKMLVTGVRHRITPDRWTCRLALDPSSPFAEVGGRWDEARWGDGEWGRIR